MDFIPLSPLIIAAHQVSEEIKSDTLIKVNDYLQKNTLSSPVNEIVKSSYHTGKTFIEDANLFRLKEEIIKCSTEFLKELNYNFQKPLNLTSWVNVFENGIMEAEHTHYNSILSGTYYVDSDGTDKSGRFYIPDQIPQREQNRSYYKLLKNDTHGIDPTPGRILFFESWVRHGVLANTTDKKRISIAFNID